MKKLKKILLIVVLIMSIMFGCFVLWAKLPFSTMQYANECMTSTEKVEVIKHNKYIEFKPKKNSKSIGLVFYVGARVDPESYAPMAKGLAEKGITVAIPKIFLNIGFFGMNSAKDIIDDYDDNIQKWFIGGHSLGGVVASEFAISNVDDVEGLILLGSYPNSDLSSYDKVVLSIFAENDKFTTLQEIEESKNKLPNSTVFYRIDGGNHEQFGWYGHQKGDGKATITREKQTNIIIEQIENLIYKKFIFCT